MAGGMELGGSTRGSKKPLDAAINLVPFIDLMAVTIAFLIMTAVWTQLGGLRVSQSAGGGRDEPPSAPPVVVLISQSAITVLVADVPVERVARGGSLGEQRAKLVSALSAVRRDLPGQTAVTLRSDDEVRYDALVTVLDTCAGVGFTSVSVDSGA